MKFWEIFRFEFGYQVRRPWIWLIVAVLIVLDFLMTRDGSVSEVLYSEFYLNSPFGVAKTTVFGSLVWLVTAAAVAGDAAARDVATGLYPLLYTAPIRKRDYLGGRFVAAFVLNALLLLAVQAGILLGVYLPGVDPELIGPFRPAAFLGAYAIISLPNAFTGTAVQFWLASRSGRPMAAYFGSFLLVFMGFFVASFVLFRRGLGTLLDPIGIRFVVEDMAHLWTPIEKNRRVMQLEGILLTNRVLWLGIALVVVGLTYLSFRFAHRTGGSWWSRFRVRSQKASSPIPPAGSGATAPPALSARPVSRASGFSLHARQTLAIARKSFRAIATSWAGLAMLALIPLLTVVMILDQTESNGVPLVPTTARVVALLTGSMADEQSRWVVIPFLLVFFAGELVWRERDAGLGEITDAMPGTEWPPFLGKLAGLGLVLALFLALQAISGMMAQTIRGYHDYEIGLYLKTLFGLQFTDFFLFGVLGLAVHVIVDHKYLGHLVAVLAFVFIALASLFGVEHNLLIYGAGPGWSYTEIRGFGSSIEPWLWFRLYWAAWAVLLAVGAVLFRTRGPEKNPGLRLRIARRRLTGPTLRTAGVAVTLILALGGFIFYNTNLLNEYLTPADLKERAAGYERRYGRYADQPQPALTAARLNIEIYPERQAVIIRGSYRLVNRSRTAIDSIHLTTAPGVETGTLQFDRAATCVLADEKLHHRIYALRNPLRPGDSLRLGFRVHAGPHGFRENGADGPVQANGTNFTNALLPGIGYESSRELLTPADRRTYELTSRPLIASLYDLEARKRRGEGTTLEVVIGTEKDQVAVAPGALRRTWRQASAGSGERRHFHYATHHPIGGVWEFFSAGYAVHDMVWTPATRADSATTGAGQKRVAIRIFHHPKHTAHLERMARSIRACFDYYSREFGPYGYNFLSVVERPGNGTGMHAEAGMITHGEGFTAWNPEQGPGSHDHPFAIVAHEMGHQWPVPAATVEGAPVMSESLAWYLGMKLVEYAKGPDALRLLRDYLRQPYPYPAIRRGEPLLRALDPYLSYRRGPFALYALSQYIGDERVNRALRQLREKHQPKNAPLATTLDLYAELKTETPDSLRYLLHDWFETNTFWELETAGAGARQTPAGTWEVTLEVQARKMEYDSAGVETTVPMNEWVEVGVFADGKTGDPAGPLYLRKHRIRSGRQTIRVKVPRRPDQAGIDPHHLLIDLKPDNNRKALIIRP
ncbi:hypothetical protein [Larkinella soli]|uniref:hypothetical protein n=1 Tax=Larkinella soli TaxID=1770527 RepID=UPI000FFBFC90|nr:hypothetical protein [Larkinella soli]